MWGNGTYSTVENYESGLRHLASHGFIVTAPNGMMLGWGEEMLQCLQYVLDQNDQPGPFRGHIAIDKIGTTGHSQGACGAVMTAIEPIVTAAAPMTTWIGPIQSSHYPRIRTPVFLQNCENDDMAPADLSQPIFDALEVAFWGTAAGKAHDEPFDDFGMHREPTTAWFRWWLMNDTEASKFFVGPDCVLCQPQSGWINIQKKGID